MHYRYKYIKRMCNKIVCGPTYLLFMAELGIAVQRRFSVLVGKQPVIKKQMTTI